jgi:predicted permease
MNVGATAALWTLGVGVLNPGMTTRESLRHIFTNPGILATVAGLLLAVFVPALRNGAPGLPVVRPVIEAAELLGALMIPLSLLVIGAQLGENGFAGRTGTPLAHQTGTLAGVLFLRLIATPVAALLLIRLLSLCHLVIPDVPRAVFLLVAAMPPALNCTLFTQRYNGDSLLSSKAVFIGTFVSLATVPLFFRLFNL